jgi:hypothetical protein
MFLKPTGLVPSAVQVLSVPEVGVPRTGVTKVGDVASAIPPEPVTFCPKAVATPVPKDVMPVPPLATGRVPVTLVVRSTKVVEVDPVPPDAIGRAAPSVKAGA